MKVELKVHSVISIIANLILTQSVCSSQGIIFNISTETDTINHLVRNGSTTTSNDSDPKLSKDYSKRLIL